MRRTKFRVVFELLLLILVIVGGYFLLRFGTEHFYKSAYPVKYADLIERESAENDVSLALIYAVTRTESDFNPAAQSSVGARGLMQITRDTFDWAGYRKGKSDKTYDDLFDPAVNVEYGTYILKLLIEEFGSINNALCAYHAGWGNAKKWLTDTRYSFDGQEIDHIPFEDTAAYVKKVNETVIMYQRLYGLQ